MDRAGPAQRARAQRRGLPDRAQPLAAGVLRGPRAAHRAASRGTARTAPGTGLPGEIRAVLPPPWLPPRSQASSEAPPSGPMGPDDVLRAIGYDEQRIATVLSHAGGQFGHHNP